MTDPDYLLSESWQRRRHMVIDRCRGECEARLEGCTGVATQVHHRTYEHFGREPLWDLTGVCDHCHRALSGHSHLLQEFMASRPEPESNSSDPCQPYDSELTAIAARSSVGGDCHEH